MVKFKKLCFTCLVTSFLSKLYDYSVSQCLVCFKLPVLGSLFSRCQIVTWFTSNDCAVRSVYAESETH